MRGDESSIYYLPYSILSLSLTHEHTLSTQTSTHTQLTHALSLYTSSQALAKHKKKVLDRGIEPSTIVNGTLEEKAVKAEVMKDVIQNVLYTLGQLSTEFPEVAEALNARLQEADLRMPTKPPSKATARMR